MDPEAILRQLGIDLIKDAEFLEPIEKAIDFTIFARERDQVSGSVLKAEIVKDAETGEEEYILSGIASSTLKDRHGDVMLPSSLIDMERAANANLTMFLNHSYDVPEDVAGSVRKATIASTGTDEEGSPIYDLDYRFRVNKRNSRAVESFMAIKDGTKLGLSIGARIPEGGAIRNKKTGRLLIAHVDLLETSIVGVPANPRSWVEAAVKAYKSGPTTPASIALPVVLADSGTPLPIADDTLKTAPGTGEPMVGVDVPLGATATLDVRDDGSSTVTITQPAPSQDAPPSTPGSDGLTASADAGAASEPVDALASLGTTPPMELVQAVLTAQAALSETSMALIKAQEALRLAEERATTAERERDRVVRGASDLAIDTAQIIQRIGSLPVGQRASFRRITQDFNDGLDSAKDVYGEETIALLEEHDEQAMSMTAEDFLQAQHNAHAALEVLAGLLDKANSAPEPLLGDRQITSGTPAVAAAAPAPVLAGIDVQATPTTSTIRRALTPMERLTVRKELRKLSYDELSVLFSDMARKNAGIPLDMWLASGGQARNDAFGLLPGQVAPDLARAIDTSTASALIRQDLEPVLYELFIREFPGFERIRKEPANGLTHTWQQTTSYGDAQFMGELGTVTDDRSNYVRQTTNVAIIATRRGVSLKSQFAVLAGGAGFNPEQLELQGGLTAMAHRLQYQIFNGHSTDNSGTANNELGLYDANAFTGLRSPLNTARAKNVNPYAATPEDIRRAINQAAVEVMQQGGRTSILWGSPLDKEVFDAQQDKNVRYVDRQVDVAVGVTATAVNTVFGALPYGTIPGDAIGAYIPAVTTPFGGGKQARDIYLLDERTITMPYLGSEGPTVLDIPIGISGQLTHLFIIFGMWGLAVKAPTFNNKVRIKADAT